ncbi:MAG: GNAT family N-acetyltransferase [Candidatus Hydrogenedentales bacterium]
MIYELRSLDEEREADVKALIGACAAFDGCSPCVQVDHRLIFRKDMGSWFLLYEEGRLLGLASIFAPRLKEGEIAICVRPDARRKGHAGRLLAAARKALAGGATIGGATIGGARQILVCNNRSASGKAFASRVGAVPEREEHALRLTRHILWQHPDRLTLREGKLTDVPVMTRILSAAFNDPEAETEAFVRSSFASGARRACLGSLKGKIVATCFVTDEEGVLSVNTLAVSPDEQGKGYGMEFLCAVLDLVGRDHELLIDVDSTNVHAMKLYKNAGFDDIDVVGYYSLEN